MPTMTPEVQAELYKEADARFAAQTGVVRKLNPRNVIDQKLIPAWVDVYNKVLREWKSGKLTLTFQHPVVAALLDEARDLSNAAAAHMDAVVTAIADKASPPRRAQEHLTAAQDAHAAAAQKTEAAATHQPPTVSPAHVHEASHQVQQFVMTAGGQGVPITNGADAVAAMQATAAPGRTAVQNAPQDFGPSQYDLEHRETKESKSNVYIIGGLVLAASLTIFGFATMGGRGKVRGRPRSAGYQSWPANRSRAARTLARGAA